MKVIEYYYSIKHVISHIKTVQGEHKQVMWATMIVI